MQKLTFYNNLITSEFFLLPINKTFFSLNIFASLKEFKQLLRLLKFSVKSKTCLSFCLQKIAFVKTLQNLIKFLKFQILHFQTNKLCFNELKSKVLVLDNPNVFNLKHFNRFVSQMHLKKLYLSYFITLNTQRFKGIYKMYNSLVDFKKILFLSVLMNKSYEIYK
jgi:hypothetical protein